MDTASPDIQVFDFQVLMDLTLVEPKVTIINKSQGVNLGGCDYFFVITTPSGFAVHTGGKLLPDVSGVWAQYEVPETIPSMGREIEYGSGDYVVEGHVVDSLGQEFILVYSQSICKPSSKAVLETEVRCNDAKVLIIDKSKYLYSGHTGELVSSKLILAYPVDQEVEDFVFNGPFASLYIPLYQDGKGYQLSFVSKRNYIFGNFVIRLKYTFKKVLEVACTYDMCCLTKGVQKMAAGAQSLSDLLAVGKAEALLQKMIVGKMQPGCGFSLPEIACELKSLLGSYYDDCCCSDAGITDINQVTPLISSLTVDAGDSIQLDLPSNTAALHGTATVVNATIASQVWTQLSGPQLAVISSPTTMDTNVLSLVAGAYVFKLAVTDSTGRSAFDTVNVLVSGELLVDAGTAVNLTLPATQTLKGTATVQGAAIVSTQWTQVSGPQATIATPSQLQTLITGLESGTYTFKLTAKDSKNREAFDTVSFAAAMPGLGVVAMADAVITLPTNSKQITCVGTGQGLTYLWTKVSGPGNPIINQHTSPAANVTGLVAGQGTDPGVYVFKITVTDQFGQTASDTVQITVNYPNVTANAGPDGTVQLPGTYQLAGAGTGVGISLLWTKVSGPSGGNISNTTVSNPVISSLSAGTYVYQLKVTDQYGHFATDTMTLVVSAPPPPNVTANAGPDGSVQLPTSTYQLNGSGTGQNITYLWTKISGPSGGNISNANIAKPTLTGITTVGTYVYQLTVTDEFGTEAFDTMQIEVLPPVTAVTANAGPDAEIFAPASTYQLNGSGTGTNITYLWTKISGPSGGAISNAAIAKPTLSGLTVGTYVYQLKVTDQYAATATDTMTLVVSPPNTFTAEWGWSAEPIDLETIESFSFQKSGTFQKNGEISCDFTGKPYGANSYLVVQYPNTEPVKNKWYNSPVNKGILGEHGDSVWFPLADTGTKTVAISRVMVGLSPDPLKWSSV